MKKEMSFKEWDGKDLKGNWLVSYKIDGIQAVHTKKGLVSKNGKKLYNLPEIIEGETKRYEVYCGSWGETWSILSASKSKRRKVKFEEMYQIYPYVDGRLVVTVVIDPSSVIIRSLLKGALKKGHEGLVLRKFSKNLNGFVDYNYFQFIKVKPVKTVDVKITGLVKSDAKSHSGGLKEFITDKGKVGIGFTKQQRKDYVDESLIGTYIEVKVIGGYTEKGKFRHSRFVRLRPDK